MTDAGVSHQASVLFRQYFAQFYPPGSLRKPKSNVQQNHEPVVVWGWACKVIVGWTAAIGPGL